MEEFPLPRMNTLPDDPLRAGEQYFFDLAGNIKKGPVTKPGACYCGPAFEKFEKKLQNKKTKTIICLTARASSRSKKCCCFLCNHTILGKVGRK